SQEQEGVDRVPLQRRRSGGRTRRSCTAARPAPVFLEECQVGARHHAAGSRPGWVLGAQRLSQLRRPMAGAAVLGRLNWHICTVVALRDEAATARTIVLRVPDWPGHVAGQRVDLRVTATDGYSAVREYSIASAPGAQGCIELSVEHLPDGEVSPYLNQDLVVGDRVELRGPIGGWFVWRSAPREPLPLVAGGSGIVPLMAMIRSREAAGSSAPFRLLYSVRHPASAWYHDELQNLTAANHGVDITFVYTRSTPANWPRPPARIDSTLLAAVSWPAALSPTCYVC